MYLALHEVISVHARASDALPDKVSRNCSVTDLLSGSRTGGAKYLNLLDDTGRVDAEEMGGDDDETGFDLEQPAILEVVIVEANQTKRDSEFDAMMASLRDFFCNLDPSLGGVVDNVYVRSPPKRMVLRGAEGVKAASIRIDTLLSVPTVFG